VRRISSRQNPLVQVFRELARAPEPGGRLLLDGAHLVQEARRAGLSFESVAIASDSLSADGEAAHLALTLDRDGFDVVEVPDAVYAVMSPVSTPSGIAAIGVRETTPPGALWQRPDAFLVTAVDVQDPGNVGGLIRTAEAGGATGALLCGASANPFSWKSLRGSMGSAFRLPIVTGQTAASAVIEMRRHDIRSVAAVARDGADPDAIDWRGRVALVLGGEGPGLPADIVAQCDRRVTIPMNPLVESLNVGVAAAVLIYAARRQRA
jgi:TrmH family RNA methyltransferase